MSSFNKSFIRNSITINDQYFLKSKIKSRENYNYCYEDLIQAFSDLHTFQQCKKRINRTFPDLFIKLNRMIRLPKYFNVLKFVLNQRLHTKTQQIYF